jgi:hypothetical protein
MTETSKVLPAIDEVTPEQWQSWNAAHRNAFHLYWGTRGVVSMCCLRCGFPTRWGQVRCVACTPKEPEVTR